MAGLCNQLAPGDLLEECRFAVHPGLTTFLRGRTNPDSSRLVLLWLPFVKPIQIAAPQFEADLGVSKW